MSEVFPPSMSVETLDEWRRAGTPHAVIDVREPWELEICSISDAVAIPLGQIPGRHAEVPRDRPVVLVCHHGMRSAQATAWLRRAGLDNAINLEGGIDAWARAIETEMATY